MRAQAHPDIHIQTPTCQQKERRLIACPIAQTSLPFLENALKRAFPCIRTLAEEQA